MWYEYYECALKSVEVEELDMDEHYTIFKGFTKNSDFL